jgi:BNR/Asp-box repeat
MKNAKFLLLFIFTVLCFFQNAAFAQHTNVLAGTDNSPNEPSICINPKNTQQLVAGANLNNLYYSHDGGATWTQTPVTSPWGIWGDPVIGVDTAGAFFYLHLSNPPTGNWIDRIIAQKSTDGGVTWSGGSFMGLNGTKAQDKHWIATDRQTNTLYVTWTQFDDYGSSNPADSSVILFSKSTDGGETWSPALRISELAGDCLDSDDTAEGAVPCVGPAGEVYVAWSNRNKIWFDRSTDGGETWLGNDVFVSGQPGGWDYAIPGIYRANGLPVTVCDLSGGPHHGTIYINWTDQRNGEDDTDVWLSKSTDGGDTWSTPVRINDDAPGRQQFFTWMAVDQVTGGSGSCITTAGTMPATKQMSSWRSRRMAARLLKISAPAKAPSCRLRASFSAITPTWRSTTTWYARFGRGSKATSSPSGRHSWQWTACSR